MGSLPGEKGYSNPVLDIERSILVLERPVECMNLRSHDTAPDLSGLISRGPTEALVPLSLLSGRLVVGTNCSAL